MIKLAASSICWARDPLPDVCRKARTAGFDYLEPLLFPREIFSLHGDLREFPAAELGKLLGDNGLKPAALHIAALWTATPEMTGALTAYVKTAIDTAAQSGCGLVVVGGPERTARHPFKPFLLALEDIARHLEGKPVRIALENHYRNWIESIADYEHIFDWIDHPQIGMTLDTGHFTSAQIAPVDVVRCFPEKIFHVHIKDHRGTESVALGTGETDNVSAVRELKKNGYTGFLSQELEIHDTARADEVAAEGIQYMKKLLEAANE